MILKNNNLNLFTRISSPLPPSEGGNERESIKSSLKIKICERI
jgi:hypothetical protein